MKMKQAPMGWNSYDYYDTTINEEEVKANANFMAKHLKQYGWEYMVVDIEWYSKDAGTMRNKYQYIPYGDIEMDEYGRLQPDPVRFPSAAEGRGFEPLAAYVHALGLKFGIHIMRGIPREAAHKHLPIKDSNASANEIADPSSICTWNPDMYGIRRNVTGAQEYYDSIIGMYADWGVDFIKCDDICSTNLYRENQYLASHEVEMLATAIEKTGREIVLSLSPGPALLDQAWHYEKYANMWRITDDFWDEWELLKQMFYRCELWQKHVADGAYPDCDMLPIGMVGRGFGNERNTRFTKEEQKTMMSLWCIFGSPLMIGAELTKLDEWTLSILTKRDILKLVSNAYVGKQVERFGEYVIWSCYNKETQEKYVAYFNLQDEVQEIGFDWRKIEQFQIERNQAVEELWECEIYVIEEYVFHVKVAPHGVGLFVCRR